MNLLFYHLGLLVMFLCLVFGVQMTIPVLFVGGVIAILADMAHRKISQK